MSLPSRVLKLETQFVPQARVLVTDWFEGCETKEQALRRVGPINPDDLVILCSTWLTCTRPGRHTHDDERVIVHPKH